MGSQTKQLYNTLIGLINKQANTPPPVNKAQELLTQKAMEANAALDTGDFRTLPKNAVFNFSRPAEENAMREKIMNASQAGTFGLADNAGAGHATQIQGQYLKDKFARDSGQNFQDNVANAAGNAQNMLLASSDAEANRIAFEDQRKMGMIGAMNNLYQFKKSTNQAASSGIWGGVLGAVGGALGNPNVKF